MQIEVLMSCYKNDNPDFLDQAISSTYEKQTIKPDSFRIVVDGPIGSELQNVINKYKSQYPEIFIIQQLPVNGGLGNALREGINESKSEYILRMDSDDISDPRRIEIQKNYADHNKDLDVIGTYTAEFIDNPENLLSVRKLKTNMPEIVADAKKRTPVSHVSVLLKRDAVIKAGNYQTFMIYEDYYLWIRMIMNGATFANIPEVLVFVRTDENRYKRKGSKTYIASTKKFQHYLYGVGFISKKEFFRNKYGRLFVAYMPVSFRKLVYEHILRDKPSLERKNEYE